MNHELATTEYSRLPNWVRERIQELDVSNPERWILKPIPALDDRSVAQTLALPEGEQLLREYFARVLGPS